MRIEFALRDESINIRAMTLGYSDLPYSHQIMLCKKKAYPEYRTGPFILDEKKAGSIYELSDYGKRYGGELLRNKRPELKYIAFVECQMDISYDYQLMERICEAHFPVWDPVAPLKYFGGAGKGTLVVFRVYRIEHSIDERFLSTGRKGRNSHFQLDEPVEFDTGWPVLSDEDFKLQKDSLIELIKTSGHMLHETPVLERPSVLVGIEQIEAEEKRLFQTYRDTSLEDLIRDRPPETISGASVSYTSKQYIRNPEIGAIALKKADGICDLCGLRGPFSRDDESIYLEVHHMEPLGEGGADIVQNTCAVCPNCHKALHHSKDRASLSESLRQKMTVQWAKLIREK